MLKSARLVLKMIALSCDCVCCEDGYMYTCEALSHVTLHSKYRTLVTACYKENGGMMKMQGPLTPRPNCCSHRLGVDGS